MISHQKLSSLTIAAIAFLAISVPTFAQTQSSHDESTQAAITVAEPTLALNRERVTVKSLFANEEISPAGIATVATRTNRPTLSMEMFKQSPSALAAAESQRFNAQTAIYDRIDNSKKQFRADDGAGPAPRPRVSFIPSRGQKVPDETIASKSN